MIGHELHLNVVLLTLAIAGAFVGRFLNRCIQRFPHHESLSDQLNSLRAPFSVCLRCSARPSLLERLPIIGWLLSLGRCHQCRRRLMLEFPAVEFVTAVLFAVVYWLEIPVGADASIRDTVLLPLHGVSGPEVLELWEPVIWFHVRYVLHMLMICSLIVATAIDWRYRIIPDGSTVPMMLLAFPACFIFGQLYIVPIWFQDASTVRMYLLPVAPEYLKPLLSPWDATEFIETYPHWHGLLVSVIGAIVGAGSIWTVRLIGFWTLKQEAMGFGDVVLMGMIGSVIGWQPVLTVFIFAPTLAIFAALINWIAHRDNEIPYGPFLSAATVLLLITWPVSWPFAKRFFDMGPFLVAMVLLMVILLAASLLLVQLIKRALGISLHQLEDDEWSSADQLGYASQERPDEQTGQWRIDQWPGSRSGRGLQQTHVWKNGQ